MEYDCYMCDGEILQNEDDKISGCARCNKCETILSPDEFIIHQKEAELEELQRRNKMENQCNGANTIQQTVNICCDIRKKECEYYLDVQKDNFRISVCLKPKEKHEPKHIK